MPFINGAGFLYRLRSSEYCEIPVMVVTGGAVSEETRAELADLHAVVRFKPLGVNELLTAVRTLLSQAA